MVPDDKPLKNILKKCLANTVHRMQGMIKRLQKHDIKLIRVHYSNNTQVSVGQTGLTSPLQVKLLACTLRTLRFRRRKITVLVALLHVFAMYRFQVRFSDNNHPQKGRHHNLALPMADH